MTVDTVPFPLGNRTILVAAADVNDLDADVHLYGMFFIALAKGGGHYERIAPASVQIQVDKCSALEPGDIYRRC